MAMNEDKVYMTVHNVGQMLLAIDDMLRGIEEQNSKAQQESSPVNLYYLTLAVDKYIEKIRALVDVSIQEMKKIEEQCEEI
ncbi:hypothetical protein IU402_04030 [Aerococcaceae bacterium zg-BR9]|uniref:hypothetical protein n=1 Tax=Aerococcaceae bacterium zg-1292 TaxID=2774330 RepID=UPI0040648C7C|nr:hypothetical protein [Aerococcaceae bacterium zg-BR9]